MASRDARLWTSAYRRTAKAVLDRDLGLCQIRGPKCTRYATEVDHIIARIDGGAVDDPANLRAACRACNAGRQSRERTRGDGIIRM